VSAVSGIIWSMSTIQDHGRDPGRNPQTADPAAWDHLGRLIRERRGELGLTQAEVHSVGGPSPATLYQLESGHRGSYRPHILRRLERALGWGAGSIRRILAGGLPVLDGETQPGRHLREERTTEVGSIEWVTGFRELPIDPHDKLLILSNLLEETIAELRPSGSEASRPAARAAPGRGSLPGSLPATPTPFS
jgi:transcriptional regulator with XRE-family HTH domain